MSSAIRFVAAAKQPAVGTLVLQCRVKPGASKVREGIVAVTDDAVEICVAAQARDGEANRAVVHVLSQVSTSFFAGYLQRYRRSRRFLTYKILEVPKSSVRITRGAQSRDKVLSVAGVAETDSQGDKVLDRVLKLLSNAAA